MKNKIKKVKGVSQKLVLVGVVLMVLGILAASYLMSGNLDSRNLAAGDCKSGQVETKNGCKKIEPRLFDFIKSSFWTKGRNPAVKPVEKKPKTEFPERTDMK